MATTEHLATKQSIESIEGFELIDNERLIYKQKAEIVY